MSAAHPLDRLDARSYALPIDVAAATLSPALIVHLDRARENARRVIELVGGAGRWRPHVKTTKLPVVFAELARAGVRHYKCATTREVAWLLRTLEGEGIADGDVVFAHHAYGPALDHLERAAAAHPAARVSVLCEDPERVAAIPPGLGVVVDVNPGMNRTGVPADQDAVIVSVAERAGARFRGIHFYDGHLHIPDAGRRRREATRCYDRLLEIAAIVRARGIDVPEIMTSGTPTFMDAVAYTPFAAPGEPIHRVSPGTVVFDDARTEEDIPGLGLAPAAVVFARVVSHPAPGVVTCDAGSKAIAAEAGDPCAYAIGWPHLTALTPSEEHLPMRVTAGRTPARGTTLSLVPRHVCPTVNLAEEAILVDGGTVLDIVPVAARAHGGGTP